MQQSDFFGIYDDALSEEFCSNLIKKFEQDDRKAKGKVGKMGMNDAVDTTVKDTVELILDNDKPEWKGEFDIIVASLKKYLPLYMEKWKESLKVAIYPELFKVTKYEIGGKFTMHSDNIGGNATRVITAIWYLNDVMEGGETEYPWQNISVKPKAGRFLLCPVGRTHIHQGKPPLSNPKYMVITQLHQKI